jgi:peptidoglycan/xylan/chitin deacetylase (PgdA/CDA1 family)
VSGLNRLRDEIWARTLSLAPESAVDFALKHLNHAQLLERIAELERELGVDSNLCAGPLLDWDQCRAMQRHGVTFGAHTVRHAALHLEPLEVVEQELRQSRARIEHELGQSCRDFAYPNGYYNRDIERILVRCGFRSAVTTEDELNRLGGDPFHLKRKTLWENHSRGAAGYSAALLGCHVDGVFGMLGLSPSVSGGQPPGAPAGARG